MFKKIAMTHVKNRVSTKSAGRRKQQMIILFAIWHRVSFKEIARPKWFLTMDTHKMLRMPQPSECCYHLEPKKDTIQQMAYETQHISEIKPSKYKGFSSP